MVGYEVKLEGNTKLVHLPSAGINAEVSSQDPTEITFLGQACIRPDSLVMTLTYPTTTYGGNRQFLRFSAQLV
jgi:hypothetical protein